MEALKEFNEKDAGEQIQSVPAARRCSLGAQTHVGVRDGSRHDKREHDVMKDCIKLVNSELSDLLTLFYRSNLPHTAAQCGSFYYDSL